MHPLYFFLGEHETKENYISALIEINKLFRRYPNDKKILIAEQFWPPIVDRRNFEESEEFMHMRHSNNYAGLREKFNEYLRKRQEIITILNELPDGRTLSISASGMLNEIYRFVYINKIEYDLELSDFEIGYKFIPPLKIPFENIQIERDLKFVDYLMNKQRANPDAIIATIRGRKHEKWLPYVLNPRNVKYTFSYYKDTPNPIEHLAYKISSIIRTPKTLKLREIKE